MGSPIVRLNNCTLKCDICGREIYSNEVYYEDGEVVFECCDKTELIRGNDDLEKEKLKC